MTGKRASMREGPLADLFRKTAAETSEDSPGGAETQPQPAAPEAAARESAPPQAAAHEPASARAASARAARAGGRGSRSRRRDRLAPPPVSPVVRGPGAARRR